MPWLLPGVFSHLSLSHRSMDFRIGESSQGEMARGLQRDSIPVLVSFLGLLGPLESLSREDMGRAGVFPGISV